MSSVLKSICAWCQKDLGDKDGEGVEGISHGICEDCLQVELAKETGTEEHQCNQQPDVRNTA
ncbi:hypothetical protein LCGC14_1705880 [marine sediment metagenome]|uniref:ClpX-type ZB domain-containing protein n=1 Tax=marine sediment metagenome TaxID=412755 RepID=A0A0F9I489_9ZZZZ